MAIIWSFIADLEGAGQQQGYVPDPEGSQSGVTVGTTVEVLDRYAIHGGHATATDHHHRATLTADRPGSVDATLELVKANGGSVDVPRFEVPGLVVLGLFRDPAGNPLGLVEMEGDTPVVPGTD